MIDDMPHKNEDAAGPNAAINHLSKVIREHTDALLRLACTMQSYGVTRQDLDAAEARIIKAIGAHGGSTEISPQDQAILDNLNAIAEARAKRLEALAAQTPNA